MAEQKPKKEHQGKKNLKVPTSEQARAYGRMGGLKSQQVQKQKRDASKTAKIFLDLMPEIRPGTEQMLTRLGSKETDPTVRDIIVAAQITKALSGDSVAFKGVLELAGEMPDRGAMIQNIINADTTVLTNMQKQERLDLLTDKELDMYEKILRKLQTPVDKNDGGV